MENNCEKNENPKRSTLQHRNKIKVQPLQAGIRIIKQISAYHKSRLSARGISKLLVIMVVTIFTNLQIFAQSNMDYAIHANIVYRFTKYIDWPESKKQGDFVIGIVGDSPLYGELKSFITNKTVGQQKIVIKKLSSSETSYNCHILFIAEDRSGSVKKIAATTKGTSTLLVSESDGLARKGSCINFVLIEDHLKLEINKNNIEERDLNIATELLSLGIIVK